MPPQVDLVIVFQALNKSYAKEQTLEEAQKAARQYTRLLETLKAAGLRAVGRKGEKEGHLLILIWCPLKQLSILMRNERHSDFISGLPMSNAASAAHPENLSSADRTRLVYDYVACTIEDGGLGIVPQSAEWDMIDSIFCLHDRTFNETWIRAWTTHQLTSVELGKIREQFGDSIALYFSFLSSYTQALIVPSVIGLFFFFFKGSFSALYSILLVIWSLGFSEWWRVRERLLALRWGTLGSFRVEKRRAQYYHGLAWWRRELRVLASIPVIMIFAAVLAALLTLIFILQTFVTQLYTGPGHKYVSFSPTIIFIALVPQVLGIYQRAAKRLTAWENHAHQSSHGASLTLKTFALTSIVAYLGLAISAFIYVPFGSAIMRGVHECLFGNCCLRVARMFKANGAEFADPAIKSAATSGWWESNWSTASKKLKPVTLRDEMFAYMVTNQIIDTFREIGMPFIMRFLFTAKQSGRSGKRVVFEDEVVGKKPEKQVLKAERGFLETVRKQAALPAYDLFDDYREMVTQYGYVALWSTIWPLAPVMALANNFLEIRSDAFKISVHFRRPTPMRTDTIGPWLDTISFIAWLSALTNASLVYLYRPAHEAHKQDEGASHNGTARGMIGFALLIALAASHGFILLRVLIRHLMERTVWTESKVVQEWKASEREVKGRYLRALEGEADDRLGEGGGEASGVEEAIDEQGFWDVDEGLEEIQKIGKQS